MSAPTSISVADAIVREDVTRVLTGRVKLLEPLREGHLVITGGTGILGTWLLELIAELNRAHGFNLRATVLSRSTERFKTECPHLAANSAFTFIEGSVLTPFELPQDTTHLIHAAAITNGNECASVPTRVAEVNAGGFSRVCDEARLLPGLQKIVLLSSGLVYGRQSFDEPPIAENHPGGTGLFEVKAVYAASKRFAETIAASYISECKLPITIARPFAFVGPYQPLHLPWAVTDFIRDAIHGGPIRIMSDGTTVRSLMYGSDFAYGILAMAVKGRVREAYNIGSSQGIDLLTLAKKIAGLLTPSPKIQTCLGQVGHSPTIMVPSTTKAETELGFKMTVDLDSALERSIAWHKATA